MRTAILLAAIGAALVAVSVGSASPQGTAHFGPFPSTSADNGSCGVPWATDTFDRWFMVQDNEDGTFDVRESMKRGEFETTGPVSPGACDNTGTPHGTVVPPGVHGTFNGYLRGTVTSSMFDPNGCSTAATCSTLQGFLLAVFGPEGPATFTCNLGYAGCSFNFDYAAGGQGLQYHHWQDSSGDGPNQPPETFRGDIATT
jgi:hypothetical protein